MDKVIAIAPPSSTKELKNYTDWLSYFGLHYKVLEKNVITVHDLKKLL